VQTLLQLLQRSSLALAPALHCAITAFQALRNSGDVFRIDLSSYYHYVYPRLMKLPFDEDDTTATDANTEDVYGVTIRCLQLMLASKTYRMSARSAAFAKVSRCFILFSPFLTIQTTAHCHHCIAIKSCGLYRADAIVSTSDWGGSSSRSTGGSRRSWHW
jgi:hypothetical protein